MFNHCRFIDSLGKQWENFLSSNFCYLTNFQLYVKFPQFDVPTTNDRTELLKTFETKYFASHQWYFAFIYRPSRTNIEFFSTPMINNKLSINLYNTHIETTIKNENMFQNVREISLILTNNSNENSIISNPIFHYVENLKLISEFHEHQTFPNMLFVDISRLIEFSRLKSISFVGMNFPSLSLVLLEYMPNLQRLDISLNNLMKMTKQFNDENSCHYLKKLIKHLNIT